MRWRRLAALVLAAGTGLVGAARAAAFGEYHPAPIYDGMVARSFYLPMRDGVRLAVRLYRPTAHGALVRTRLPVIWHASLDIGDTGPNARSVPTGVRFGMTEPAAVGEDARDLSALTRHGYVVAVVARRGAGASFGRRRGYEDRTEADDSYEVTEWLARQDFSDGEIGVYGCSNTGEAAMHVLTMRPPHLRAVFAGCFSFDRWDGFVRGGIIANWGAGPQRSLADDLRATRVDGDADGAELRAAAASHQGSTYLLDLMRSMPYRDSFSDLTMSRFWAEASVRSYLDAMRASGAALYIQGGWRDDFRGQGLIAWKNYLPGKRFLLIGDWTHCSNVGFDLRSEQLRFFDHFLRGIDTGITEGAPIHTQLVDPAAGTRTWQRAFDWPPPARAVTLDLAADGALGGGDGANGSRAIAISTALDCPGAVRDPRMVALSQPCDPSAGGARWTGPVLEAPERVVGHAVLHVRVAANWAEPRLFAYLEDVFPDGRVSVVSDARLALALRATSVPSFENFGLPWHRAFAQDLAPLVAGRAVAADLDFLPVAYVFGVGHRIRVALAAADPRERLRPAIPADAALSVQTGVSALVLPVVAR